MIYIVFYKKDGNFANRIGLDEIQNYAHFKDFRPLLEKRGTVVYTKDPLDQVNGVYKFAKHVGEPSLYISFSPPDQDFSNIISPKIFICSLIKYQNQYFSGSNQFISEDLLRSSINTSLAGIAHCVSSVETISNLTNHKVPMAQIPPPIWDSYNKSQEQPTLEDVSSNTISTNGNILDTTIRKLKPKSVYYKTPIKRKIEAIRTLYKIKHLPKYLKKYLYQKGSIHFFPTKLELQGVVFTAVIRPSNSFKDWKKLIVDFIEVFKNKEDAILIIKMVGQVNEQIKESCIPLLRQKSIKCRIIIIFEHLPESNYKQLVRSTSFILNISSSKTVGNSLLEFMSAGKPAISPNYSELHMLSTENTIYAQKTNQDNYSLNEAFVQAYEMKKHNRALYLSMAKAANDSMKNYCSSEIIETKFFQFLDKIEASLP